MITIIPFPAYSTVWLILAITLGSKNLLSEETEEFKPFVFKDHPEDSEHE